MSLATTDLEPILLEDVFEATTCESVYERENGFPEHPAHWYVHAPCGDISAVCERRRAQCRRDGGWWCSKDDGPGCKAHHDFEVLVFERIGK